MPIIYLQLIFTQKGEVDGILLQAYQGESRNKITILILAIELCIYI